MTVGVWVSPAQIDAQTITNWVAFNDHRPTAGVTHPNATGYDMRITGNGGVLKNFSTGKDLTANLVVTVAGSDPDDFGANNYPNAGSPAFNLFDGIVDVGNSGIPGVRNSASTVLTLTFTNLNPAKRYLFRGTAVRGNNYDDRWTAFTVAGAPNFTDAHVIGDKTKPNLITKTTFPSATLGTGQVALNSGENRVGSLVAWDNIDPGADGAFSIDAAQYIGPAPFGNPEAGPYGYGFTAIYLAEVEPPAAAEVINWKTFNDHRPTDGVTNPNVTGYDMRVTGNGGVLKNFSTGKDLPVSLLMTHVGSDPDDFGANNYPNAGSPAFELFDGIVDVGNSGIPGLRNSGGTTLTLALTGLNPAKRYKFRGTVVRGNNYDDRWTVFTMTSAISYTDAHVIGDKSKPNLITKTTFPSATLAAGQVALNSGENKVGSLVGWDNIDPGADGTFSIDQAQYIGPAPFGNPEAGPYGYGFTAIYLAEVEAGAAAPQPLAIQSLIPSEDAASVAFASSVGAVLINGTTSVDESSIKLSLDGAVVKPTVTKSGNAVTIQFQPAGFFAPNSTHSVSLEFKDNTGKAATKQWSFTVQNYNIIAAGWAVQPDKSKPGFVWRYSQVESIGSYVQNSTARTEAQLAGLLGENIADPSVVGSALAAGKPGAKPEDTVDFEIPTVINLDKFAGNFGNFQPDDQMPGCPGLNGGTDNNAADVLTFLELPAGVVTMGVNSDDGFRVTAGANARDLFALKLGEFNGGRGAADTTFKFVVEKAGIYPFRMIWENGGGDANVEWFTLDGATKILINDAQNPKAVKAYRAAKTPPYAKSASPGSGARLVPLNTSITVVLADSDTAVQTSSVQLFLDGQKVNATVNKPAGSKETTITFKPATDLARALHTVKVVFGDDAGGSFTSEYTFSTEEQILFTFDDATVWRYNREGIDLGTAWRDPKFNDSAWEKGVGPIGDNSDQSEPVRIRTVIDRNSDAGDHITTLYVRGHFNFSGTDKTGVKLFLTHMIDDGGVFYLNGVEVHRFGIGSNVAVTYDTFAAGHEAAFAGPYEISTVNLLPGDNVFAAEIHQSDAGSSDIVFGAQLTFTAPSVTTPPTALKFTVVGRSGANLNIEWSGTGTLQSADAVIGPWADVAGAKSPFSTALAGNAKFFRLRQ